MSELGRVDRLQFRYNQSLCRRSEAPDSMEYFVEFDRQIARNTVAAVGFYYRTNERLIGSGNLPVPTNPTRRSK